MYYIKLVNSQRRFVKPNSRSVNSQNNEVSNLRSFVPANKNKSQ